MKKINKISIIAILTLALSVSLAFAISGVNSVKVNAQQNTEMSATFDEVKSNFNIIKGASIRIDDKEGGHSGIRFETNLPTSQKANYDALKNAGATFGTIILPKEMLGENALTLETNDILNIKNTEPFVDEVNSMLKFRAVVSNIPEQAYTQELTARGYITYNGETFYTDMTTRDISYVAYSAKQDNVDGADKFIKRTYSEIILAEGTVCEYKYAYKGQVLNVNLNLITGNFIHQFSNTLELKEDRQCTVTVDNVEIATEKNSNGITFAEKSLPVKEKTHICVNVPTNDYTINYNAVVDVVDLNITVDKKTLNNNIYNNAGGFKNEYVPFSDYEKEGMATDYTGNAIKISTEKHQINGDFYIKHNITKSDYDKAIAKGYKKLSVVVGRIYDHPTNGMGLFDGLLGTGQWDSIPGHTWKTYKLDLNQDLANKLFDSNGNPQETQIFRLWSAGNPTPEYPIKIYIGDVKFDEDTRVNPDAPFNGKLVEIKNESVFDNIYNYDHNFSFEFVSKENIPQGDYVGNAVKITSQYRNANSYKIKAQITRSQYEKAVSDGYTKIKVPFYFKPTDPSTASKMYITTYGLFTWQDSIGHDQWKTRSVTLNDELMNKLFDAQGNPKETEFFQTYVETNATSPFELYIGEIVFAK